jgi:methyltransferase (TIGR00027 family)
LPGGRTSGIARTRLIDDWITVAVRDRARQVAILGAGFDSRAWRLSALAGIPVFEVDHPIASR